MGNGLGDIPGNIVSGFPFVIGSLNFLVGRTLLLPTAHGAFDVCLPRGT